MKNSPILSLALGTSLLVAPLTPSFAQFKKFKSKTNFKRSTAPVKDAGATDSPAGLTDALNEQKKNEKDIFGRGTGINNANLPKKDSKYVNLNPETAFGPGVVENFDYQNVSLSDLTKAMQELTGINLILDGKDLKGKVTIAAPQPITIGDAWKAYLTALNTNGYTLVKNGAFYRIVSTRDIRYTPTKIYTGSFTPNTANYVMKIFPLKNISAKEVSRSFRPFMSRYGRIIDIPQTNTIIVQDTGNNINRLSRLIKFVDVPGFEESLQIIPIRFASAQEIATLLNKILKAGSSKFKSRSKKSATSGEDIRNIIHEPRTNSIIAYANADGARQLRALIKKLDVEFDAKSGGQIHVYYVQYGSAEEISKTIQSLTSGSSSSSSRRSSRRSSRFANASSSDEAASLFNGNVKITADKSNNALVITASPTDYLTVREVLKKLDIPKEQVYVEGLVLETNASTTNEFGISLAGAYGTGLTQKFGNNSAAVGGLVGNGFLNLSGFFAGLGAGGSVDLDLGNGQTTKVQTVNGLIRAVAGNANSNVLATPQILALDNVEAVFESGESIPTVKTTTSPSGQTNTSTESQDVNLTLKITPQINKITRFIKMKIEYKVEDFSGRQLPSALEQQGLATINRSAVTEVVIRDKDTLAMGGLMRDKIIETTSKVPLLGDIPILGWLFKNKRKEKEKVDVLFFLTPQILSPYEKTASAHLKDSLNRRATHLQDSLSEDNPNNSTLKALYEKAKRQSQGPLYDEADVMKNDDAQQIREEDLDQANAKKENPNYQDIIQSIIKKQSGLKRN